MKGEVYGKRDLSNMLGSGKKAVATGGGNARPEQGNERRGGNRGNKRTRK